jgi:alkylation response protein AidB-like acyl-CoA dehydrogenase
MGPGTAPALAARKHAPFGSRVPYAEPGWYQGQATAFYNESHVAFRAKVRAFVDKEMVPFVDAWEEEHERTGKEMDAKALCRKAAAAGVLAPSMPAELGGTPLPGGVKFDHFHDLIWIDELARCGASGMIAGITIWTMALPPILNFASQHIKDLVVKPVLRGEKSISLCITEPYAGSDVASLRTSAVREGDHFVLNGQKKWISCGHWADYFTVACRTGGKGAGGVSLLLVDATSPGISVRRMKLQGNWLAGTSVVTFEDVRVPVSNIIGKENEGFKPLMINLNHERFVIASQALRQARLCIEDAIEFASNRDVFGSKLIKQDIIRDKIANMVKLTEATQAMGESLAFQMDNGIGAAVGGPMALYKVMAAECFELCAREASQILGGASYTREGKGQRVERLYREVRSYAIPGGSLEVLNLFAVKAAKL